MRVTALAVLLLISPVALARAGAPTRDFLYTQAGATGADVFVSAQDGSDRISLTGGVGLAADPAWSPDGAQVAFVSSRDSSGNGPLEIDVVGADGSSLRRLTFGAPAGAAKGTLRWAPDGSRIAYLETLGGPMDVWTILPDGGTPHRVTTSGGQKTGLDWSPDGTRLMFTEQSSNGVFVTLVDATTGAQLMQAEGRSPEWSPDGTRIAFVDPQGRVAVMDANGASVTELTDLQSQYPAWSPDGLRVVFAGTYLDTSSPPSRFGYPSRTDLYSAPADASSEAVRITGPFDPLDLGGPRALAPSFSPDGTEILYRENLSTSIWAANVDGRCARPLAGLGTVGEGPYWRPGSVGAAVSCVDVYARAVADPYVALGQLAHVRLTVENHGNLAADVLVHVFASTPGTLVGTVGCDTGGFECHVGSLAPRASRTVSLWISSATPGTRGLGYIVVSTPPDITPDDAHGIVATTVLPCTIVGSWGADRLSGTVEDDRICGLPGPDIVSGGAGDDYLSGGSGNDTIFGGKGHDTILGGGGRDVIFARDGQRDYIDCGTEYDVAVVDRIDHVHHCERVLRK
jgi:Tol biopolymer transport system component